MAKSYYSSSQAIFTKKTVWQAIIKKQTLPQKFKQKPQFCHTNLSCHTEHNKVFILRCHTEPLAKYPLKYKKHLKYKNKKREKTKHKAVLSKI